MAGLFKALHVLRDRRVPANIHVGTVNPHIDVLGWNLAPVTEALDLGDEPLVVGVSAFGFGGTNAHAVLVSYEGEAAPGRLQDLPAAHALPNPPLLLSARSPQALRDVARDMAQHLRDSRPGREVLESRRPDGGGAKFDKRRGWFVAYDGDGTIRTFFVPAEGIRYFESQARNYGGKSRR